MAENGFDVEQILVRVLVSKGKNQEDFLGSAFILDAQFVLTARHVVENINNTNFSSIILRNGPWSGDRHLDREPIRHPRLDMALLKLRAPNNKVIKYGELLEKHDLQDEDVTVHGFIDKYRDAGSSVHRVKRLDDKSKSFELHTKVEHGNSGGPVIFDQHIVGIIYARSDPANSDPRYDANKSFIFPVSVFKQFLLENGVQISNSRSENNTVSIDYANLPIEIYPAFINRIEEWRQIQNRIEAEKDRKAFAFVVAGVMDEWPEALEIRLKTFLNVKSWPLRFNSQTENFEKWEDELWARLLEKFQENLNRENLALKIKLLRELNDSTKPCLYYWLLEPENSQNLDLIKTVIENWESLELNRSKYQHCLLIVHALKKRSNGMFSFYHKIRGKCGDSLVREWRQALTRKLTNNPNVVLPLLESPTIDDAIHWSNNIQDNYLQTEMLEFIRNIKTEKIPHFELKRKYIMLSKSPNFNS